MKIISAQTQPELFLALLKEYTDSILQKGAFVQQTLSAQNLADEFRDIYKKYGPPGGRMYLAMVDDTPAGCIALTENDKFFCEMKRLYVRPEFRGRGISRKLTEQVISDAREIGYRYMRLDTFDFMVSATKLYEKLGFRYIGKYNDNPAENAVFMELTL